MELTLTSEQATMLGQVLDANLRQLLQEISHTDSRSKHKELTHRHDVVTTIRAQLALAKVADEAPV